MCGVYTHVEAAGHGNIDDVHYTMSFDFEVVGTVCVTLSVAIEGDAKFLEGSHTNVYGILIKSNDLLEMVGTKCVSGEDVVCVVYALLIKLTIGYTTGVMGVTEATVRVTVSE